MGTLFGTELSSTPTSSTEGTLSSWYAPYATNLLDRQQALSGMGFTPYSGQLTAGPSDLQSQYFQGVGSLTMPTQYGAATQGLTNVLGSTFDTAAAQKYMNPYLQASLNPQLEEARRQADITRMQNASRLTQAGAFGGSRQAIMDAETQRNLGTTLANITGTGYNTAYDKAMAQYNADLARQAGASSALGTLGGQEQQAGLANLAAQQQAGGTQRDIQQAGLAADYGQYMREFNYPQEQLANLANTMKVLPSYSLSATNTYGQVPGTASAVSQGSSDLVQMLKNLKII
jgi:hypothetical protein